VLDFADLTETVTVRRVTATAQSARGKVLASGVSSQAVRCLIQPHRGNLKYEVEGALQDVTESLYCNPVSAEAGNAPTDIRELDTVVRADGRQRRVAFVSDEGGQGDHFKVYLVAVTSGTSGTEGDAQPAPGGNPALPPVPSAQAQIDALTQQIGTIMTSLRQSMLPQLAELIAPAQTTSAAPLAAPALPVTDYLIQAPVITAARTDFAYSSGSYPRILKTTYKNPEASTAAWTVTANTGETFATTDGGAGLTSIIMQPGESRTMETTSATTAGQV